MKRTLCAIAAIISVITFAEAYGTNATVYVATDDIYYHDYGCEQMHNGTAIPVEEAYWKYLPCKACDPPVLAWDSDNKEYIPVQIHRYKNMYLVFSYPTPPAPEGEDPEYFEKIRIRSLKDGTWARLYPNGNTMKVLHAGKITNTDKAGEGNNMWSYIAIAVGCILMLIGLLMMRGAAKFRASMEVVHNLEVLKYGGTCKLSVAQIANMLVNLSDAQANLSKAEFKRIYRLYKLYQKEKTIEEYDADRYTEQASRIIVAFNNLAPFVKYSGEPSEEIAQEKLELAYARLVSEDIEEKCE